MRDFLIFIMILNVSFVFGQFSSNEIRPFRIGVKIGIPNTISLEGEYVTPLLNNRLALFTNYTGFSGTKDQVDANLKTFEVGTNIYISKNNEGSGLYGSISYQQVKAKLEIEDYEAEDGTIYEGNARAETSLNGVNIKLGVKLGKKFFFRTELGYSFGQLPKEILVEGNFQGEPISEIASIENEIEDLPLIFQNGIPIFNIGIGYAF